MEYQNALNGAPPSYKEHNTSSNEKMNNKANWAKFSSTDSSCNDLCCVQFQQKLKDVLILWLNAQTGVWKNEELLKQLHHFKSYDQHSQLGDIEICFRVIAAFSDEIQNSFDNHVCFHSISNDRPLEYVRGVAYNNVTNSINQHKFRHSDFIISITSLACQNIYNKFEIENSQIFKKENILTRQIIDRLTKEYKNVLKDNFQKMLVNPQGISYFVGIETRLKSYVLHVLTQCLEIGVRINPVQSELSKEMQQTLSSYFENKKQKFIFQNSVANGVSPLHAAVKMYMDIMKYTYDNLFLLDTENILSSHENACTRVFDCVISLLKENANVENIKEALYGHLTNLMTKRHKTVTKFVPSTHTTCITISSKAFRVWVLSEQEVKPVMYHNRESSLNYIAVSNNSEFLLGLDAKKFKPKSPGMVKSSGNILGYLNYNIDPKHREWAVTQFITAVKNDSEKSIGKPITSALILVPKWYSWENRICLQKCAKLANFSANVLLSVSSVAAYGFFVGNSAQESSMVIPISVSPKSIVVEIYAKDSQVACVKLVALSKVSCDDKRGEELNFDHILHTAMSYAISQLSNKLMDQRKTLFLLGDYTSELKVCLEKYVGSRRESLIIGENVISCTQAGARELRNCFGQIRERIIDYLEDINAPDIEVAPHKMAFPHSLIDLDLSNQKSNLIFKVNKIKTQIEEGQIMVSGLLRLFFEMTLEKIQKVASNDNSTQNEIAAAEKELIELVADNEIKFLENDSYC